MTLLERGVELHGYVIRRIVDAGGMCNVYEALTGESKTVAIKAMHHVWALDEKHRQRFLNEVHLLKTLRHAHLVEAFEHGELPSGEPYMVLEWLPHSLQSVFDARKTAWNPAVVLRLSEQLAQVLVYLHEQNIVHRDIKAANVLLDRADVTLAHVKLADLGLAKVAPELRSLAGMNISTGGQSRLGTWDCMAPEQWVRSKDVDAKADVYSLGVLMLLMLSGELPFVADDAKNLMRMHVFVDAPMERLQGKAPRGLLHLVGRMLKKDPKERLYMAEVAERIGILQATFGVERIR